MEAALQACDSSPDAPTVVYVSKMVAVPAASLPRGAGEPGPPRSSQDVFLAFGRVFAGRLRQGQRLHVLSAAYDPHNPADHAQQAQVISSSWCWYCRQQPVGQGQSPSASPSFQGCVPHVMQITFFCEPQAHREGVARWGGCT